jgi:CxxC motif-containing protein (DUF1111 family)
MKPSYLVCCVAAAVFIFGPVGVRVLSWQKTQQPAVDSDLAQAGEMLFKHEWQVNDALCPGGDGLGPVFNARSCVACHHQNAPGGGGGLQHNVTTYLVLPVDGGQRREGVIHAHATREQYRETLKQLDPSLPAISQPKLSQLVSSTLVRTGTMVTGTAGNLLTLPANVRLSQRNTPALFGVGLIDGIPERILLANQRWQSVQHGMAAGGQEMLPVGRAHRLANGKIGRFGWKAQMASLSDFVQAACAGELGLGNPGHGQPPSMGNPNYQAPGLDLTQQQCDQLTAYVAQLPRPAEKRSQPGGASAEHGKTLFAKIGCAFCHTPDLGSVEGIYSDLLLHRMGATLEGGGTYYGTPTPAPSSGTAAPGSSAGPMLDEWRTPPLWGVADSAPYLHDGRAATLEEAIKLHGGQGAKAAENFEQLSPNQQAQVVAFLQTLRAP